MKEELELIFKPNYIYISDNNQYKISEELNEDAKNICGYVAIAAAVNNLIFVDQISEIIQKGLDYFNLYKDVEIQGMDYIFIDERLKFGNSIDLQFIPNLLTTQLKLPDISPIFHDFNGWNHLKENLNDFVNDLVKKKNCIALYFGMYILLRFIELDNSFLIFNSYTFSVMDNFRSLSITNEIDIIGKTSNASFIKLEYKNKELIPEIIKIYLTIGDDFDFQGIKLYTILF